MADEYEILDEHGRRVGTIRRIRTPDSTPTARKIELYLAGGIVVALLGWALYAAMLNA